MEMRVAISLVVLNAACIWTQAQSTAPPQAAGAAFYRGPARDIENLYKGNFQRIQLAAEAMPADQFHYKPHADSPSFAGLVRTVIDGEHAACDEINETPVAQRSPVPAETATKDEMLAALKLAGSACERSYAALSMENAGDLKVSGNTRRGQISILAWNYAHNSEQYGMMSAYLADKGVKPAAPPRPNPAPQK
jgi:hypothetical protein